MTGTDVLIAGLSTANKIGLGLTGLVVISYSLVCSFVFPRRNPNFPGRGLPAFMIVTIVLFVAMLTAVEVFGVESESGGEEHTPPAQTESTS